MDCIPINILGVSRSYSFVECNHPEELGKVHKEPLCVISYNCM